MKKSEIKPALDSLKEIKMPKIENKELRNALIENHFVLFDASRKLDAAIDRLRAVKFSAYKEEQEKVAGLQQKLQTAETVAEQRELLRQIQSYEDYAKAAKEFAEEVDAMYKEELEGLKPINREKFTEAIQDQDYKMSWFEGLYPMFILEA